MTFPHFSTVQNQRPLQASKWLDVQMLIDGQEMQSLFEALGDFSIFVTGAILLPSEGCMSHEKFLQVYQSYIQQLLNGEVPDDSCYRQMFSAVFTRTPEALYALDVGEGKVLLRPSYPVVQLQHHTLGYSTVDHKFRSMVFGKQCMSWGIQFSYPQLFEDPVSRQIVPVERSEAFPNSELFHELQKWTRRHTLPTPFHVETGRVNVPIRLGKSCFEWINRHPQLVERGLTVG